MCARGSFVARRAVCTSSASWLARARFRTSRSRLYEDRLGDRGGEESTDLTSGLDLPEDFDDLPEGELEDLEEEVVDRASAAKTIAELEYEISTLRRLEQPAEEVRRSGTDAKWPRLAELLQDSDAEMFDEAGKRRKLTIFSEHRDTPN